MSEKYIVNGETLTDIADAIREKTGSATPMEVSEMAARIASILGEKYIITEEDYRAIAEIVEQQYTQELAALDAKKLDKTGWTDDEKRSLRKMLGVTPISDLPVVADITLESDQRLAFEFETPVDVFRLFFDNPNNTLSAAVNNTFTVRFESGATTPTLYCSTSRANATANGCFVFDRRGNIPMCYGSYGSTSAEDNGFDTTHAVRLYDGFTNLPVMQQEKVTKITTNLSMAAGTRVVIYAE